MAATTEKEEVGRSSNNNGKGNGLLLYHYRFSFYSQKVISNITNTCCMLALQRGDSWSSGCAMMQGLVEITNFTLFLKFLLKTIKNIKFAIISSSITKNVYLSRL
jgi:hypothetical protein